ncbi:hypothetical protein ALO95_200013 [Pseudomonas syringae pv. antirrhini]|uniref:NYN domain-containing protein n=1 Tax=Pseudomonas syringae pv. antirrhini TaxID=251702 RepID=A0A0P9JT84_9PSED|nr:MULTISPECIES: NYN domain-containing protein [Pseudomonas]KPW52776.1 Uncharacterized protein ALO88_00021 [Pseudomonas syringae pv. antirrhini]RMP42473.1 hypothetical protein ALQ23_200370 [Pseudomonas syringae pv. antirrhini]RMW23437.1 hypothetical protein ALO95_200013 [Pseudomonas syringae pv. antirrhini]WIN08835.1 NYN domain-containing protein [Pseudomonas syringae pv. antirrhini str. 126]
MERVGIYYDGGPFLDGIRGLGMTVDIRWADFMASIIGEGRISVARFFISRLPESPYPAKYQKQARLVEELTTVGIHCHLGRTEIANSVFLEKGVEALMATKMLQDAYEDTFDRAFIISNRMDLLPALEAIELLGKKVETAFFDLQLTKAPQLGQKWKKNLTLQTASVYDNSESGRRPFFPM